MLYKLSVYITIASTLFPLLSYLLLFRKMPKQNHMIGLLVVASLLSDVIGFVQIKLKTPNIITNNLFNTLSFILISLFYYHLFLNRKLKTVFFSGSFIYALSFFYFIFNLGFFELQTSLWSINSTISAVYGILYFIILPTMLIDRLLDKNLNSYLVINGSFVFYFSSIFLLFLSAKYVFQIGDMHTSGLFWSLHNFVNMLKNIGLAIGLYYTGRRDVKTTLIEIEKIGREKSGKLHDDIWAKSLRR